MASAIRFSEAAALGLHTVALLFAYPHKTATTKELAQILKSSEAHLAKVLQRLAKAGFIRALRGPKGGFEAIEEFAQTPIFEVLEVIDGPIKWDHCLFSSIHCDDEGCLFRDFLKRIDDMVLEYLKTTKIQDLANECKKKYKPNW